MAANLRSMVPVCREPGFLGTTLVLALVGMPMMAFLAVSSYIYLEQFAIGYVGYSAFYAFTAGVGVLSPFVYLRLSGRVGENAIAKACLVVMGISGVMIGLFGYASALGVLAASVPLFFVEAVFRAQGFVALLEDRTESRGAANSVATFIYLSLIHISNVAYCPSIDPQTGQRIVNELADRRVYSNAIVENGVPLLQIVDERNIPKWNFDANLQPAIEAGITKKYDSIDEVIAAYDLPADAFKAQLERYNGCLLYTSRCV